MYTVFSDSWLCMQADNSLNVFVARKSADAVSEEERNRYYITFRLFLDGQSNHVAKPRVPLVYPLHPFGFCPLNNWK